MGCFSSPILLITLSTFIVHLLVSSSASPNPKSHNITEVRNHQDPPDLIKVTYHNGPVLTGNIQVNIIWYGSWPRPQKQIIRDFITSLSAPNLRSPSVSDWWKTLDIYTDQTNNNNPYRNVTLGQEKHDRSMSQGRYIWDKSIHSVINSAITSEKNPLPIHDHGKGGFYLVLTADDVHVKGFCHSTCGSHGVSYVGGYTLPYAFVGNSGKQCREVCAYPFAVMDFMKEKALRPPNGDVGIDGMVSVIGSEITGLVTDPFGTGWYAEPHKMEIGVVCRNVYGESGVGYHKQKVFLGGDGASYNMYGVNRRFMVPWVYNYLTHECFGHKAN